MSAWLDKSIKLLTERGDFSQTVAHNSWALIPRESDHEAMMY